MLPHDLGSDGNRYRGIVITNKERNALKAALKRRGVEVSSGELGREFNASSWGYDFATENTMYFGRTLSLAYSIREESGELVLGKASVEKGAKDRELNAVILELDRITCLARVRKDDVSVMELIAAKMERFVFEPEWKRRESRIRTRTSMPAKGFAVILQMPKWSRTAS